MPAKTIKDRLNEMTEEQLKNFFSIILSVVQKGQNFEFPESIILDRLELEIKYLTFPGF